MIDNTVNISYLDAYSEEARNYFKQYHSNENIINNSRKGFIVVAVLNGEIIGTGTLIGTTINRVFITPELQHIGYGKLIMFWLERKAKKLNLEQVDLSASLVSKRFYDSLGYTTTRPNGILCENKKDLKYFEMEKKIL